MSYKGNSQNALTFFIPYSNAVYELATTSQEQFIEVFNYIFKDSIKGYNIEQFSSYDKYVLSLPKNAKSENDKLIADSLANSITLSTLLAICKMQNISLIDYINLQMPQFKMNANAIPDIGFTLFKTGKSMNSKVKFERFILFISNANKLSKENMKNLLNRTYQAIRKFLTAGKLGENGMRLNDENSYYPPTDALNDILKLIENIITEANAEGNIYYGIDCNANNYYSEETGLYEMDGFKKQPDKEQLIDFYLKLATDHPLLKYLEDPMADTDLRGWAKLLEKFASTKPEVKIASKSLIGNDILKLGEVIDPKEIEEQEEKEEEKKEDNVEGEGKAEGEEQNEGKEGDKEGEGEENAKKMSKQQSKKKMTTLDPRYRSRLINNIPHSDDVVEELTPLEKEKIAQEEARKKAEEEERKRLEEEEEEKKRQEEAKKPGAKKPVAEPQVKNKKKTEEELQKEKEEEEKALPPPLPIPLLSSIALYQGKCKCVSELFDISIKLKNRYFEVSLYDNPHESEQSGIIDLGLALRVNKIILHGFTNKPEKMSKIIQYIEQIEELY
jgi:hypothetical protein